MQQHIVAGQPIEAWTLERGEYAEEVNAYTSKQVHIELRNCGKIDPEKIDDYIAADGYKSIQKCIDTLTPEDVIDQIRWSGLRGRGGAGFLTALKWEFARRAPGDVKYLICNADEGRPGRIHESQRAGERSPQCARRHDDRSLRHRRRPGLHLLSGPSIPWRSSGSSWPSKQARQRGFLGKNILGSDFSFDIEIKMGAGAFVCGEETALIASIEGERGMPRLRPPLPCVFGTLRQTHQYQQRGHPGRHSLDHSARRP